MKYVLFVLLWPLSSLVFLPVILSRPGTICSFLTSPVASGLLSLLLSLPSHNALLSVSPVGMAPFYPRAFTPVVFHFSDFS